jgi:hypothetical protein
MSKTTEEQEKMLHEIMQPLNIIRLSCSNVRTRISNNSGDHTDYIVQKMERIEEQVIRATQLLQDMKTYNEMDNLPNDD